MRLYQLVAEQEPPQLLEPVKFSNYYREEQLENWLRQRPDIITCGEPLIIVGQQVKTTLTGGIDLLALDSSGTTVIVELKRDKAPRTVLAQALEYAAWVSQITTNQLISLANDYLSNNQISSSLSEAWQKTFGGSLEDVDLNRDQRIVIVAEGSNRRIQAVVNYLSLRGLDSTLLEFHFHRKESDVEILDFIIHSGLIDPEITESRLISEWSVASQVAYKSFREKMILFIKSISIETKKDRVRISVDFKEEAVFLCSYKPLKERDVVELRRSSLQKAVDADEALSDLGRYLEDKKDIELASDEQNQTYYLRFVPSRESGETVAAALIEKIASRLK